MDSESKDSLVRETTLLIYGGKREVVGQAIESVLNLTDEDYYQTWVRLGVMKRLSFLFEGGVESAGSLGGLSCMFAVMVIVLALFAFWNLVVLFAVILVLTLLSGGAAFKFMRATYITAKLEGTEESRIDAFVRQQVVLGRFVQVKKATGSRDTSVASRATLLFKRGIQFSLLTATIFLIAEVIHWLVNGHWLSGLDPITGPAELQVLIAFGALFILGVVIMDVGVVWRFMLAREWANRVEIVD